MLSSPSAPAKTGWRFWVSEVFPSSAVWSSPTGGVYSATTGWEWSWGSHTGLLLTKVTGEPPSHASVRTVSLRPATSRVEMLCVPRFRTAFVTTLPVDGMEEHVSQVMVSTLPFEVLAPCRTSIEDAIAVPPMNTMPAVKTILNMCNPVARGLIAALNNGDPMDSSFPSGHDVW